MKFGTGSLCFFAPEGVVKIYESLFIFKGLGHYKFEQDRKTHEGAMKDKPWPAERKGLTVAGTGQRWTRKHRKSKQVVLGP